MSKVDFENLLKCSDIDSILDDYLFNGLPCYFKSNPQIHSQMIGGISEGLEVSPDDICVVGSARTGFSLSPYKFGQPFGRNSDIDVVVVSSTLFDPSWIDILTFRQRNWHRLKSTTRAYSAKHKEKHHIYNEWIYPNLIADALEIGNMWVLTFNGLSRIPELSSRSVRGRLYRTWDHVREYHRSGLRIIKKRIIRDTAGGGGS